MGFTRVSAQFPTKNHRSPRIFQLHEALYSDVVRERDSLRQGLRLRVMLYTFAFACMCMQVCVCGVGWGCGVVSLGRHCFRPTFRPKLVRSPCSDRCDWSGEGLG